MNRFTSVVAMAGALAMSCTAPSGNQDRGGRSALEADPTGWMDLFPGKDLKGWKRADIDPKTKQTVWSLSEDGKLLLIDGRNGVKEDLLFDKEFTDGIWHVEWRWAKDQGEKPNYNGGVFVRAAEDGATWIQAQVARQAKGPVVGDIIELVPAEGKPKRVDAFQKGVSREAPMGEWNTYEVVCKGKSISVWVNGGITVSIDDCPLPKGRVGLQAEFALYEIRTLKFKELK